VKTAKGTVQVPVAPKRVVSVQPSATASLYDVGVDPIGVYDQGAAYMSPRYLTTWEKAAKIGTAGEIHLEQVAALRPDLIVGLDFSWNTDVYDKLTAIAPTVIAPITSWQESARVTADAVNKAASVDTLSAQVDAKSAMIKQKYADVLARFRWDILQGGFDTGQYWLYGPGCDAGTILAAAGVRFAPASTGVKGADNKALSYERIGVLSDADVIGYYANFDGTPNNEGPALFAQPSFQALPAVKAARTVPLPDFLPGGYGDALALLDELELGLIKLGSA
jgi:iron complex transport system substrate-binding protein